jgi:hypothetical protein
MMKWAKKLFFEEPTPPEKPTTMVEVLQELWDVDQKKKEIEHAPPNVSTDIYTVADRDKGIPRRPRTRRQHYRKAS